MQLVISHFTKPLPVLISVVSRSYSECSSGSLVFATLVEARRHAWLCRLLCALWAWSHGVSHLERLTVSDPEEEGLTEARWLGRDEREWLMGPVLGIWGQDTSKWVGPLLLRAFVLPS